MVQETAAVHFTIRHFGGTPSVSTQVAALRRLLLVEKQEGETGEIFRAVSEVRSFSSSRSCEVSTREYACLGQSNFGSRGRQRRCHCDFGVTQERSGRQVWKPGETDDYGRVGSAHLSEGARGGEYWNCASSFETVPYDMGASEDVSLVFLEFLISNESNTVCQASRDIHYLRTAR